MDDVATSVFGFFHKNAVPWTKERNILYRNLKEKIAELFDVLYGVT
jgi:hypothetical protein